MSIKKTISVTNHQQLVDLNQELTNFELEFNITAKNGETFYVLVIDQTTLDNDPNFEFKTAEGSISGNIVSDNNVYQNYYLCLKADEPCDVDIEIDIREIQPKNTNNEIQQQEQEQQRQYHRQQKSKINWKFIILVLIIIATCVFIYFKCDKDTKYTNDNLVQRLNNFPIKTT